VDRRKRPGAWSSRGGSPNYPIGRDADAEVSIPSKPDPKSSLLGEALAARESELANLPTMYELCITGPLYSKIHPVNKATLLTLRATWFQFDCYCVECGKETPFRKFGSTSKNDVTVCYETGIFSVSVNCSRCGEDYTFFFKYDEHDVLTKIGQDPSIEDITGGDLKRFRPLLRDGYYADMARANGLISHGIGIGAFVYLRRVFEKLIADHRATHERANGPIGGFDVMRMEERIEALSSALPPALVRNRSMYGILSKGIHELSEDECKLYYPAVRAAILQILEQDFEARARDDAEKAVEIEIQKITQSLKAKG
jgi:hypothetical protein